MTDPSLVDLAKEAGMGDYFPEVVQDGRIRITCYFPEHKSAAEVDHLEERILGLREYGLEPGMVKVSTDFVKEEDWATSWKSYYHTLRIGKVVIQPSWETTDDGEIAADDVVIMLDPGMAFGTGTHPTTAMCLEFLQQLDLEDQVVWDVGTGSGILAIASAKLGAKVHAVDVDLTAVQTAKENRDLNGVEFPVGQGSLDSLSGNPKVIVANIIADVILDLLPKVGATLESGGFFIAGGIIDSRADEIESLANEVGLNLVRRKQMQEWVGYCFIKE